MRPETPPEQLDAQVIDCSEDCLFSWLPAVFGGRPFPSAARRAKENSPAIYRWVRSPGRSKSRRDDRTLAGCDPAEATFLSSLRDLGAGRARLPSDESLGYSRSSLRDWTGRVTKRNPSSLARTAGIYSTEKSGEPFQSLALWLHIRSGLGATLVVRSQRSSTPTGLQLFVSAIVAATLSGLICATRVPRVARASQPWANRWNTVGVQLMNTSRSRPRGCHRRASLHLARYHDALPMCYTA